MHIIRAKLELKRYYPIVSAPLARKLERIAASFECLAAVMDRLEQAIREGSNSHAKIQMVKDCNYVRKNTRRMKVG